MVDTTKVDTVILHIAKVNTERVDTVMVDSNIGYSKGVYSNDG